MKKVVKEFVEKNKASRKIAKLSDAQKLLAKYIQLYEMNELSDSSLRTMAYVCKTYAEISKIQYLENIEYRLGKLESEYEEYSKKN